MQPVILEEEKDDKNEKEMDPGKEDKQLFDARVVLISSPVSAKMAHFVNSRLLALEKSSSDPIYIFINSPGGEVHSGFAIFDMIRFIKPRVISVVAGLAASMGSIIPLASKKEDRFAFPNSKFLVHQPSISGGLGGSVSDIHAKDLIDTKNKIVELYVQETGQKEAVIRRALDRDSWLSAPQAIEFGLISKIISRREDLKNI